MNNYKYTTLFPSLSSIEIQTPDIDIEQAENESESFIQTADVRQSHNVAEIRKSCNAITLAAIEQAVNVEVPQMKHLPIGEVIRSVDAVGWRPGLDVDIRPRLYDKATNQYRLLDSGSQISATCKLPGDEIDESVRLVAVNGSKIKTYGFRDIVVKINRKRYTMPAIICDISQDILGADFLHKYKLGLEWDDFDQKELYIVDKRANIKSLVQMVTVPADIQRVHYLESSVPPPPSQVGGESGAPLKPSKPSNEAIAFQVSCMKKLTEFVQTRRFVWRMRRRFCVSVSDSCCCRQSGQGGENSSSLLLCHSA